MNLGPRPVNELAGVVNPLATSEFQLDEWLQQVKNRVRTPSHTDVRLAISVIC